MKVEGQGCICRTKAAWVASIEIRASNQQVAREGCRLPIAGAPPPARVSEAWLLGQIQLQGEVRV